MNSNLFEYLKWRGDLPLDIVPFNEVDGLILSSFIYARFTNIVCDHIDGTPISIGDAINIFLNQDKNKCIVRTKQDFELLNALKDSPRFKDLMCFYHKEVYDHENETQFGAMTIKLNDNAYAVIYRGTDNYVAGWKEDLNLSFRVVPAQELAASYLNDIANICDINTSLYIMGHSKGGHLAMYAAAFANNIDDNIKYIYNFDGPGFDFAQFNTDKLFRIKDKLKNYTPKWSFVGSFMSSIGNYNVVDSNEFTVIQHDSYAWICESNSFKYVNEIDKSAKFVKELLDKWLGELNHEERKNFVNAVYEIIDASKAEDIRDIIPNILKNRKEVQGVIKDLDEKTSQAISLALSDLRKIVSDSVGSSVSNNINQLFKRKD